MEVVRNQTSASDNVSLFDLTELSEFEKLKKKGWIGACRRDLITPIEQIRKLSATQQRRVFG